MSFNEMCQKLTFTMHRNFNGLKMQIIFEPEKSNCLEKNCCNSASKKPKSSCKVSKKTYRSWKLYELIISDTIALSFSKFSIKIGYILLKHPVQSVRKSEFLFKITLEMAGLKSQFEILKAETCGE